MKNNMLLSVKDTLQIFFVVLIFASILLSYKVVKCYFLVMPVGIVTIALSFVINCVYTELFGNIATLRLIITSAVIQIAITAVIFPLIHISSYNNSYTDYLFVFGSSPLVAIADAICLTVSFSITTYIMHKTKHVNRKRFIIRSILATILGESAYNAIWVIIAMHHRSSFKDQMIMAGSMIIAKLILSAGFSVLGVFSLYAIRKTEARKDLPTQKQSSSL